MKINSEGNRYVKELREYLKSNFVNPPKDMYLKILEYQEQILVNKCIIISQLFSKDREEYFKKYNKLRLEGDNVKNHFVDSIITILKKIIQEESKPGVLISETRASEYKDVIIKDGEVLPDVEFDVKSLKLNLFYNNKIEFGFNENINIKPLDRSFSFIQSLKLDINGSGDQVVIPSKYEVICTARVKGAECGNIVEFCDIHKNSALTCSDSPTKHNPGHPIKKLEIAPVKESVVLYSYDGKEDLDKEAEDLKIFSLVEITKEKIICNAIYVVDNKDEYLLILSVKEEVEDNKTLVYNILKKDEKSRHFLDDIYKSLQYYFIKEHDIVMTNQNKIIGEIIMFILLNKLFYNVRMNALIVGSSGSGKSFWSSFVIPMFTFNNKVVSGSDITRNRFLGGRSNMISAFKNSLFQVGFVGTQDVVFCEESTEPLNKFFDVNNMNKESNIFSMLKIASGPYNVGIQGSRDVIPKASVIMVGNLEQLNHIQKYKELVAKRFRNYSAGEKYKNNWPLFKPLEFYDRVELAKAHMHVRKYEWTGHYVTKLPEAEYARLAFMITLEDEESAFKTPEMEHESTLKKLHRIEFVNELKAVFNQQIPIEFKKEIYNYYVNEFLKNRNNIMKNGYKKLNTHILKKQFEIVYQFIFMNKLYYKQELKLTDMDKSLVEDFMLYNHNCINSDEAALIRKPLVNDYLGITDEDELLNYDLQKKEDYVKKLEAEKKELEDLTKGEDLIQ